MSCLQTSEKIFIESLHWCDLYRTSTALCSHGKKFPSGLIDISIDEWFVRSWRVYDILYFEKNYGLCSYWEGRDSSVDLGVNRRVSVIECGEIYTRGWNDSYSLGDTLTIERYGNRDCLILNEFWTWLVAANGRVNHQSTGLELYLSAEI